MVRQMKRPSPATSRLAVMAGLILFASAGAVAQDSGLPPPGAPPARSSRDVREHEWGQAMFIQYLAASNPWPGERVQEFVNRLGQNLARASGSAHIFTFRVVHSPEPNARAFPGGFVVVHSGAVGLAGSEAELASVLAHEIAHVNARHWQRRQKRAVWLGLLTVVPLMFGASPLAMTVSYGSLAASPLEQARFSRSFEKEADRLALVYLARAGYDPEAALTLFEKYRDLRGQRGGGANGLLASHSPLAKRARHIEQSLGRISMPSLALETTSEFESVREEVLAGERDLAVKARQRSTDPSPAPPKLLRRRATD